jgi:peptidoglycan hydrolase CwlO-like protein
MRKPYKTPTIADAEAVTIESMPSLNTKVDPLAEVKYHSLMDPHDNPFIATVNKNGPQPLEYIPNNPRKRTHLDKSEESPGTENVPMSLDSPSREPTHPLPFMTPSTSAITKLESEFRNLQNYMRSKKVENSYIKDQLRLKADENEKLRAELTRTQREIERMKSSAKSNVHASPAKAGTAALKLQLNQVMKENEQLNAALVKSDEYIEQLRTQLETAQSNISSRQQIASI